MNKSYVRSSVLTLWATLLVLPLVFSDIARADDDEVTPTKECFTKEDFNSINLRYKLYIPQDTELICRDSKSNNYKIIGMFYFFKQLKFDQPNLPSGDALVTPMLPDRPGEVIESIRNIDFGFEMDPTCANGSTAYAQTKNRRVVFCPGLLDEAKTSFGAMIAGLLHEAWHIKTDASHVHCKSGPFTDRIDGCDEDIQSRGAYGAEVEFSARVAAHAINVHPALRDELKFSALTRTLTNFNVIPKVKRSFVPVVLTQDGTLWIDKPKRFSPLASGLPLGFIVQGYNLDLYSFASWPGEKSVHLSAGGHERIEGQNAAFSDYMTESENLYNDMSDNERMSVRGLYFGKQMTVILKDNHIDVYCRKNGESMSGLPTHLANLSAAKNTYAALVFPQEFADWPNTVSIRSAKNQVADLTCDTKTAKVSLSVWRPSPYKGAMKFMKIGGTNYILDTAGHLVKEVKIKGQTKFVNESTSDMKVYDFFGRDWTTYIDGE